MLVRRTNKKVYLVLGASVKPAYLCLNRLQKLLRRQIAQLYQSNHRDTHCETLGVYIYIN